MSRCLVIGASGQLGRALCRIFREGSHGVLETVRGTPAADQRRIDLSDPLSSVKTIRELEPEWILIAGAFCNVDRCEEEKEVCYRVNVEGPLAVAGYARERDCRVVYYSTDHVFDGSRETFQESDSVKPLNLYARSKAEGERVLRGALPEKHLILRTAWLYGPDPMRRNFALRLVDQLRTGCRVQVPSDQWGCPTTTEDLARATRFLLEQGCSGTFHATGPDFLDRVSLGRQICRVFDLDPVLLNGVPTRELGQRAVRPLRVRLDCEKLRATGCSVFEGILPGLNRLRDAEAVLQGVRSP